MGAEAFVPDATFSPQASVLFAWKPTHTMHAAVLGAGYAGLALARSLERSLPPEADITVVDGGDSHLVQHLLHRVVRKPSLSEQLSIPFEELFSRADHRQATVTGVDPDAGRVELADGSLAYDAGAVCLGARTAFYGLDGVAEHATPLKTLEDARRIREEFEPVRETGGRAVVGGAGLSGIQVAGELAELAREADTDPEVVVLEQEATVAPSFPDRFRRAVADALEETGVDVRTGRTVERATPEAVVLTDGTELPCDQFVWTGGIAGQNAVGSRPEVRADLRLGERTFALGDAARVVDSEGRAVPATAQTAVRQADVAATNVERLLEHRRDGGGFEPRLERYRYESLGWLVSVGDATVAQVGPSVLRGAAAHALKTTVGAGYLGSVGAVEDATDYVRASFAHDTDASTDTP